MVMLAFCKYARFWSRNKDLRDSVKTQYKEGFERCEGVAEVHQGGDEDQEVEHERANIAQRHCDKGETDVTGGSGSISRGLGS